MRTMIFIIAVVFIAVVTVVKRRSRESAAKTETSYSQFPAITGYDDEKIVLFIHSFSKDKDVKELGVLIEDEIEDAMSDLLIRHHVCRVEFITVGYNLVVVIRARLDPEKAARKGGIKLWRKQ